MCIFAGETKELPERISAQTRLADIKRASCPALNVFTTE